jgi:multimeric flavodoxin WrbA
MKVVVLFGSPRRDGNTIQLVNVFCETLKNRNHDVRTLYLNEMNIRPCQGCLECVPEGVCRINDDMKDVRKYIVESDLIVYATPVYWWAPSAQLKLAIDRSIAFFDSEYHSRIAGKKAVTLMTFADQDPTTSQPALDMFTRTFGGLGLSYMGGIEVKGCEGKVQIDKERLEETRKLAESIG